jgi:hypothetical protein
MSKNKPPVPPALRLIVKRKADRLPPPPAPPPPRLIRDGEYPPKPQGSPNVLLGRDRRKSKSKAAPETGDHCGHEHVDEKGFIHKCFHKCRSVLFNWSFWLGVTLSFPIEHFLWEKVWPFYHVTAWMGL